MEAILNKFEKVITYVLLIVSMIVISYQTLQLIWELGATLWSRLTDSGLTYDPNYTGNIAVLFFSVLLSLEIMETIRMFHENHEIKIRLIFVVAMIAISRKLLSLSTATGKGDAIDYLTTAGLILAFAVGYYLIRKVGAPEIARKGQQED